MAQYRVTETSFINNKLVQAGDIVEYEGRAGKNLELIKTGKGKKVEAEVETKVEDETKTEDETGLV